MAINTTIISLKRILIEKCIVSGIQHKHFKNILYNIQGVLTSKFQLFTLCLRKIYT